MLLLASPASAATLRWAAQRDIGSLDRDKRLAMMTEALGIAKARTLFLPVHQQPMAWAMRDSVEQVVQLPDNKARHWLTRMRE